MPQQISDEQWRQLLETRATRPEAVAEAYANRKRPEGLLSERGTIFLVAADHPARGALASGADAMAMADRRGLLERLMTALSRPGVDGVLGSPDIVEELLLLGALEGKVVVGLDEPRRPRRRRLDDGRPVHRLRRRQHQGVPARGRARCCCGSTTRTPAPRPPSTPARRRSPSSPSTG